MTQLQSIDPTQGSGPWATVSRNIEKWFDAKAANRALWIFISLFVVIWTAFQIISYQSIDLRDDLTEIFAWSRHPSAGYYKHPPLAALMAAIWFQFFQLPTGRIISWRCSIRRSVLFLSTSSRDAIL